MPFIPDAGESSWQCFSTPPGMSGIPLVPVTKIFMPGFKNCKNYNNRLMIYPVSLLAEFDLSIGLSGQDTARGFCFLPSSIYFLPPI